MVRKPPRPPLTTEDATLPACLGSFPVSRVKRSCSDAAEGLQSALMFCFPVIFNDLPVSMVCTVAHGLATARVQGSTLHRITSFVLIVRK